MAELLEKKPSTRKRRGKSGLNVSPDDIFIFPVPDYTYKFLEKVWSAFVNKLVALTFTNNQPMFNYAVFEAIQDKNLKIVSSATHFKMKEIATRIGLKDIQEFINRALPVSIQDQENLSANFIREAIISVETKKRPEVVFSSLKDEKIHPNLRHLLSGTMNYAAGIPLFVKGNPIGMIWGIRRDRMTDEQREEVREQLSSLYDVVDFVVAREMDNKADPYIAKKNIEKADLHSYAKHLYYTRTSGQVHPVTSIIFDCHTYNCSYRLDASYIIPSSNGFSVSLKRFEPEKTNDTGKILLLIPGFFCRRSVMDKVAREMALKYGYRVFSMDMRGRSRQTLPYNGIKEGWTIDDFIQEDFPAVLNWIRESFPKEKIVVMGHSMGGMIPRYYASAYETFVAKYPQTKVPLPDPKEAISGIISVTSPNFVSVGTNIPGMNAIKTGLSLLPTKSISDFIFDLTTFSLQSTLPTVDLNKFFKFLLGLHSSLRTVSFELSTKVVNLRDFVGYRQISPPEWYFLIEDIFCEESTKVILQFIRSQLSKDHAFFSFDGSINYTELQKNFELPIYSVLGTLDKIVPVDSVEEELKALPSKNNQIVKFDQGHLGILFHMPTVREMCAGFHDWIQKLD